MRQNNPGRWRTTAGLAKGNATLGPYASKKRAEAAALAIQKYGITEARRRVPPDASLRPSWTSKEDSILIRRVDQKAKARIDYSAVTKQLPGRSLMAVRKRVVVLRKEGKMPPARRRVAARERGR